MGQVTVVCVLRSGGDYDAEYVDRLGAGVARHLPGARFVCLSDVPVACERRPLRHGWPGWWAKMEIFAPSMRGDLLYIDLDTVPCGDLGPLSAVGRLTVLAAWNAEPGTIGSGLMYLPEACRAEIWSAFTANPDGVMAAHGDPRRHGHFGDQGFLLRFWRASAARWQTTAPGRVLSYKADRIAARGIPTGASVICFHGRPRPRAVDWLSHVLPGGRSASPSSGPAPASADSTSASPSG